MRITIALAWRLSQRDGLRLQCVAWSRSKAHHEGSTAARRAAKRGILKNGVHRTGEELATSRRAGSYMRNNPTHSSISSLVIRGAVGTFLTSAPVTLGFSQFQGISRTSSVVRTIYPQRVGITCVYVRAAYLQPGHAPKAAGGEERYHLGMDGAEARASRRPPEGCPTCVQSVKDEYARRVTEVRCVRSRLTSNSWCNG
jgi:hypothetical protein